MKDYNNSEYHDLCDPNNYNIGKNARKIESRIVDSEKTTILSIVLAIFVVIVFLVFIICIIIIIFSYIIYPIYSIFTTITTKSTPSPIITVTPIQKQSSIPIIKKTPTIEAKTYWSIQICSVKTIEEAKNYLNNIKDSKLYKKKDIYGNYWLVVVVGKYNSRKEADRNMEEMKKKWAYIDNLPKLIQGAFSIYSTTLEDPSDFQEKLPTPIPEPSTQKKIEPTPEVKESIPTVTNTVTIQKDIIFEILVIDISDEDLANKYYKNLTDLGYSPKIVLDNKNIYINIGTFLEKETANLILNDLKEKGFSAIIKEIQK